MSPGGRQAYSLGLVGPTAQTAAGAMRPTVGATGAGLEVCALRTLAPAHPSAMVSAVWGAELAGIAPHGPRAAGGAVCLRLRAAAQFLRLVTVGHVLSPSGRHALFRWCAKKQSFSVAFCCIEGKVLLDFIVPFCAVFLFHFSAHAHPIPV